ncbi:MAG: zinc ribbon domain-containing protein [Candidatus Caldarchaeum sp.]|nr:zinc ribbon domain-containing protein [Candidatus Caldarchaeum sp.]
MKKLAFGYFLSAFNSLCLTPLVIYLIYPALVTYPMSIFLRGYGWRSVKDQLSVAKALSPLIIALGGVTYVFILASLIVEFEWGLPLAAASWTVYSISEAGIYVSAARATGARLFYGSPVSLVGVAVVDIIVLNIRNTPLFTEVGETFGNFLYVGVGALVLSALLSAVASLKLKPRTALTVEKRYPALPSRSTSTEGPIHHEYPTPRPLPRIQVEVLRQSTSVVCKNCRTINPVDAAECFSCGRPFAKASTGLKCPVCQAPFTMAKLLAPNRFLCGQCASTLDLKRT